MRTAAPCADRAAFGALKEVTQGPCVTIVNNKIFLAIARKGFVRARPPYVMMMMMVILLSL